MPNEVYDHFIKLKVYPYETKFVYSAFLKSLCDKGLKRVLTQSMRICKSHGKEFRGISKHGLSLCVEECEGGLTYDEDYCTSVAFRSFHLRNGSCQRS